MTPKNYQVSYYEILQLSAQAGDEDVKRAYRRLALHHHPDKHPSNRRVAELRFRLITEAYNHLKTAEGRRQYNRARSGLPASGNDNHNNAGFSSWMKPFMGLFQPVKKQV